MHGCFTTKPDKLAKMFEFSKSPGIAVSQCAIGDGVNADNIRKVLAMLAGRGFDGVLSMECEGNGGPMIEKSLAWLRATLKEPAIKEGQLAALGRKSGTGTCVPARRDLPAGRQAPEPVPIFETFARHGGSSS